MERITEFIVIALVFLLHVFFRCMDRKWDLIYFVNENWSGRNNFSAFIRTRI